VGDTFCGKPKSKITRGVFLTMDCLTKSSSMKGSLVCMHEKSTAYSSMDDEMVVRMFVVVVLAVPSSCFTLPSSRVIVSNIFEYPDSLSSRSIFLATCPFPIIAIFVFLSGKRVRISATPYPMSDMCPL